MGSSSPPDRTSSRKVFKTATSIAVAIAGLSLAAWQLYPWGDDPFAPSKAYYTVDDGKTLFTESAELLPPFSHDGRTAYKVMAFTCDGGKTKIVGYLQRLSDLGKEKMKAMREQQKKSPGKLPSFDPLLTAQIELKKPGAAEWAKQSDVAKAHVIMDIRCPDHPERPADPIQP